MTVGGSSSLWTMSDLDLGDGHARPLSARESGALADTALYEGVPEHLRHPLQQWLYDYLSGRDRLARRVAVSVRLAIASSADQPLLDELVVLEGQQLLDTIDLALQYDDALDFQLTEVGPDPSPYAPDWDPGSAADYLDQLQEMLTAAGSVYTVHCCPRAQLVRRLDPTVARAVAVASTEPSAGHLLNSAWRNIYGLHPNATTAYREAVRAVEQVACPLVLATAAANNSATLGTVRNHLRDAPHKWQFVLTDKDGDGSVEPLVMMLDRLWTGQVSRHGGGQRSRDQTTEEAQAAVHLAALLVQLLGAGALTRRTAS